MRVLVIDKVAVIQKIRERYNRLVGRASLDMTLLVPSVWLENATMVPYQPGDNEGYRTIVGRTSWPGHEIKSVYYSGLLRAFRQSRPEVILMMEEAFSLFALQVVILRKILAPRAPIIFYACSITTYDASVYRPKWFFRDLGKMLLKRTEGAICINAKATQMLHDAGFEKARTLFFGIDERGFAPMDRSVARRELGIADDLTVFMYAGRLLRYKGIDDLIEAFRRLRAQNTERRMKLWIAGEGEYGAELQQLAARSGLGDEIEFLNAVPITRMPYYMSAINALVLPSRAFWNEQFGRVLVEAMLAETPVIGSTSGEIPMVIGDTGYIFPADDIDALAATMQHVLQNPGEAIEKARQSRQRALREFSMGSFVDGLVDLLEDYSHRPIRRGVVTE